MLQKWRVSCFYLFFYPPQKRVFFHTRFHSHIKNMIFWWFKTHTIYTYYHGLRSSFWECVNYHFLNKCTVNDKTLNKIYVHFTQTFVHININVTCKMCTIYTKKHTPKHTQYLYLFLDEDKASLLCEDAHQKHPPKCTQKHTVFTLNYWCKNTVFLM